MNILQGKELIQVARDFAHMAHTGQFRKDKKTLYFTHVEGVARAVTPQHPEYIATAYLHDVIEDTSYNSMDLTKIGIPRMVVSAVLLLTKFVHKPYEEYLKGIKNNVIATAVKIADMKYNLNDTPSPKQVIKYTEGLQYLGSV